MKRLNVPVGHSVTLADLEEADDDNSESSTEDEHNGEVETGIEFIQNFKEGDWVKVKFSYDKGIKVYIGKVTEKLDTGKDKYNGTFLRQSNKCSDILVFPDVPDVYNFSSSDVLAVLKPPTVQRGCYAFKPYPLTT
ncbi:hypothetical protein PR048_000461 [Dryococelus australis]|uniref:Uncharacterized protein n=1 Tax=Dryococelus australis TaxID=614101 RepID=A0ABQ9IEQ3_9NEOP|nr:hypothetical protein PR048_000461 [Dryococelus australis]